MKNELYGQLFDFCVAAYNNNEKKIVRCQRKGRPIPIDLKNNQKLFSIVKWPIMESSLLYRTFISKAFDEDNALLFNQGANIQRISILHKIGKVVLCESHFSLNNDFPAVLEEHVKWAKEKKAKLLVYMLDKGRDVGLIDRYLKRKGASNSIKKLKIYENDIKFDGEYMNILYFKIAKKESFMTLMKEIL